MNRILRSFGDGERLLTIPGSKHGVPRGLDKFGGQLSDSFFVFHDEHRLAPPHRSGRNTLGRSSRLRSLVDEREVDLEPRAFPTLRLHPNAPAALLNDPINGSKPQSSSLALFLGGEERLENARLRFVRQSMTHVRNLHEND